ncbi:MAG: dihydropteroate synthase [Propionibacteriaceae bacterium]|nr:dihydropteroate synthase [Propionibacteriaceae bacterium]
MGIVNCTPDSFSDGGDFFDTEAAITHGIELIAQGADIIDVGGESTRPGARRPSAARELQRVLPVIAELAKAGAVVSVDTMRASVAEKAVEAGAAIVNDVSGGLTDTRMLGLVAELNVGYIAQHWRGVRGRMSAKAQYQDVVQEVRDELLARVEACLAAGIQEENVIIDPGLGFAKNSQHNWLILKHLDVLIELGCPVLIGASRKRFLAELLGDPGAPRPPKELDGATAALTALLTSQGVWAVRTHTVRDQRDAIAVAQALSNADRV